MNTLDMMSQLVSRCPQSYYQRKDLEMVVCARVLCEPSTAASKTRPLHLIIQSGAMMALCDNVSPRCHSTTWTVTRSGSASSTGSQWDSQPGKWPVDSFLHNSKTS